MASQREKKWAPPLVELRGENEVWVWLPEDRTDITIVRAADMYRITVPPKKS